MCLLVYLYISKTIKAHFLSHDDNRLGSEINISVTFFVTLFLSTNLSTEG